MRSTETDIAEAVLAVLAERPSGEASIAELISSVPLHHTLTEEDKTPSTTRPGEAVWEQQVRNITSHKQSPGNYINEGFLEAVPGGLKITAVGKAKIGA